MSNPHIEIDPAAVPHQVVLIPESVEEAKISLDPDLEADWHNGAKRDAVIHDEGLISPDSIKRTEGPRHSQAIKDLAKEALKSQIARHELRTDHLTGIPNRTAFLEELEDAIALDDIARDRVGPNGEVIKKPILAVMFMDLDGFKVVNDTLGHDKGDEVLIDIAKKIHEGLRDGELLARRSGDEFEGIVRLGGGENGNRVVDATIEDIENGFGDRIQGVVAEVAEEYGVPGLGASIGFVIREPGESAESLARRVDAVMYAKKSRRKSQENTADNLTQESSQDA